MRFLADENFPAPTVSALIRAGHDVVQSALTAWGKPDDFVLNRAQLERRMVLTCDKGFGELAFRHRLPADCGVVLFRLATKSLA